MEIKEKILNWVNKAVYWEIILIPFVASFSSAAVNVFTGLLIFSFILKKIITKNYKIINSQLIMPFILLILVSLISFFNSVNLNSSLQGIVKLLKYGFLLIILVSEVKDKNHIKLIVASSLFGLLMASLDGIYQLVYGVDFFRHKPYDTVIGLKRLKAAFPHTNIFSGYLALFVPVALPLFFYHSKPKRKLVLGLILALSLFCLYFTFSRSAVLGVALAIILMGIIKKDKLILFLVIIGILAAPFLLPKGVRDWSKTTNSAAEFLLNKDRLALYETSFNMIKHHPVLGVGVNTYCLNYQKYKLHNTEKGTENTMWYAHNSYLQMASEIGILGLLIFLYLLGSLFQKFLCFYRKNSDSFKKFAGLGLAMGILAFLVHGLTETNLYYPKIAVLFWYQVGLLAALINLKGEEKNG